MRIGLIGASYTARSTAIAGEECINFYPETRETSGGVSPSREYGGASAGGNKSLLWTPGLSLFTTINGPTRASLEVGGRMFAVGGTAFYEIASTGAVTTLGTVNNDGTPASMAFNGTQILVVAGGKAYCYTLATAVLLDVTPQLTAVPVKVQYCNSYFVISFQNSRKEQISDPLDGTTWPGLYVNEPTQFAENVTSNIINHSELWVFGARHAQVYQNTGSAEIFDSIPGATIEQGCVGPFATCLLDNSVFWVSEDERGGRMAWRSNGYTPQRISTHAVEIDLISNATLEGLVTYSYQDGGHLFWVLYVPGSQWSWVYDVSEGLWHKRASWSNGAWGPHKSWNHVNVFGRHIVGDWATGNFYTLTQNAMDDSGAVLRRARRAPTAIEEMAWIYHKELNLDFEMGNLSNVAPTDLSGYASACFGPLFGGTAVDTLLPDGFTWLTPSHVLLNDGSTSLCGLLATTSSNASSTSVGTSQGGGVAWTNPANVDAGGVSYASVSLSAGSSQVTPSQTTASASNSASPSNQNPPLVYAQLSGFASTLTTEATLYITINGNASFASSSSGGSITLFYSVDSGSNWTEIRTWAATFSSVTLPVTVTGFTDLDTVRLQLRASAGCGPSGFANFSASVTNWYAVLAGAAQLTSQTLVATVTGLRKPADTIVQGIGIAINADYSGVAPSFQVALNVGSTKDPLTLTTTPTVYNAGGSADLWGYTAWDDSTLSTLKVNFFATTTGTTTVNLNQLVVTVYYTVATINSDALDVTDFGFALPLTTTPQGLTATMVAYATLTTASLTVQPMLSGSPVGYPQTLALPTEPTEFAFGTDLSFWGAALTVANLADPTFGLRITASATGGQTVFVRVGRVKLKIFAPPTTQTFNYIGPDPNLVDGNGNPRAPQAMVRWSDDRGKTWSNEHTVDLGFSGQTKVRAILRRLGRSRYRIYEVVVSDPVPWVLVDGYLEASQ